MHGLTWHALQHAATAVLSRKKFSGCVTFVLHFLAQLKHHFWIHHKKILVNIWSELWAKAVIKCTIWKKIAKYARKDDRSTCSWRDLANLLGRFAAANKHRRPNPQVPKLQHSFAVSWKGSLHSTGNTTILWFRGIAVSNRDAEVLHQLCEFYEPV